MTDTVLAMCGTRTATPDEHKRVRNVVAVALVSILLLVPCFWQQRIQAGDLSSHIYNSWLEQQIESGNISGLVVAEQRTNILFDLLLGSLYKHLGAQTAQRIAVSLTVLIFFWASFAFISTVNGTQPWFITPVLAMVTYGWTFHSGLFNFYLSIGLSLWAVVLLWKGGRIRIMLGFLLLVLSYVAHGLGFCWAAGLILYSWLYSNVPLRRKSTFLVAGLISVLVLTLLIRTHFITYWSPHQFLEASGIDQVWTFGAKYSIVSVALALLWGFLFLRQSHAHSASEIITSLTFQLSLITATVVLVVPTRIELPGFSAALTFISERMTLPLDVLLCCFFASSKPAKWQAGLLAATAVVYFSFIYVDTRALNTAETQLTAALVRIPTGQRVFSSFQGVPDDTRIPLWIHATDRACIGKCLSYNNYEPYSAAFRIRTVSANPFVVSTAQDHYALKYGGYVVGDKDLPLYQLQPCGGTKICAVALKTGEITKSYPIAIMPVLWKF